MTPLFLAETGSPGTRAHKFLLTQDTVPDLCQPRYEADPQWVKIVHNVCGLACILGLTSSHNQVYLTTKKRGAKRMAPTHSGKKINKSLQCSPSKPSQEKADIFKPSRFEPLYQPYFRVWFFAWSRCAWIVKRRSRKDPGTKITRYYLRRHLYRVIGSRRHWCPKLPQTFERKLCVFWLKEPLVKLQKSFCFCNFL